MSLKKKVGNGDKPPAMHMPMPAPAEFSKKGQRSHLSLVEQKFRALVCVKMCFYVQISINWA